MRKLTFRDFRALPVKEKLIIIFCILLYMKPRYKIVFLVIISCLVAGGVAFQQARGKPEQEVYQNLNRLRSDIMEHEDGLKYGAEIENMSDIYQNIEPKDSASGRLVEPTAAAGEDIDPWGKQYFIQDDGDIRKICSSGGFSDGCMYYVLLPHRIEIYSKKLEDQAKADPRFSSVDLIPKSLDDLPPESSEAENQKNAKN